MEVKRINEFVEGDNIFESRGISRVKVTKLIKEVIEGKETEKQVIECLEIPIQSTGVSELMEAGRAKAPSPPIDNVLIKQDSDTGREMGLAKNTWVKMPNLADPDYIRKKEKFDSDLGMKILFKGLAVDIKDKAGNIVEDENRKLEILKGRGMSTFHFSQIINDITGLTTWNEGELENFLG